MNRLIRFVFCALPIAGLAQQSPQSLKTFVSPNGLFRFQYSDGLVNCLPEPTPARSIKPDASERDQPTSSLVPDSCMSQGEMCDGPGSEGSTVACFAYPKERLKDKPAFVAAAFYVSEIQAAKTEKECLQGSPNWFVINSTAGETTINHVSFKTFEIADNWTSGGQSGPAYRTFHNGMCYELGIQTSTSRAEYEPGTVKPVTKKDWSEVGDRLKQPLNSFVFLK